MTFEFFDPDLKLRVTAANLPHWYQPEVTYFVTWRTADSLPRDVAGRWYAARDQWLTDHGIDPSAPNWSNRLDQLPSQIRKSFHEQFSRQFQALLDAGHGECALRRPEVANVVKESLLHFDNDRYLLGDFVVMPNHVHLIVGLMGDTDLQRQCFSWKKFTATTINKLLNRRGEFWQTESFDHLIRSADHFEYFRQYIRENPVKAGLREGESLYYHRVEELRPMAKS